MASPFPLNIGPKQDSWDKLQILQHIDPSLKLTAAEINAIVAALEYLYNNTATGSYQGNIPAIMLPLTLANNNTPILQRVATAVNALPETILPNGQQVWFYTKRFSLGIESAGAGEQYAVITDYFLLLKKIYPVDGSASIGTGTPPLTASDFANLHREDTRSVAPQRIDLGTITPPDTVVSVINSGPLRSTPNLTTTIFTATESGNQVNYLYIGQQEEVGTGATPITLADLIPFPTDPTNIPPLPAPPLWYLTATIATMISHVATYNTERIIRVADASADLSITFPAGGPNTAYYRFLGTNNGDLTDFELVSVPNGASGIPEAPVNNEPHVRMNANWEKLFDFDLDSFENASNDPYARNSDLPTDLNELTDNQKLLLPAVKVLTQNTTLQENDNNIIFITPQYDITINPNTNDYGSSYAVAVKNPDQDNDIIGISKSGVQYQVNDESPVNSGTFTLSAGGTCAIVYSDVTKIFYIDGDFE